MWTAAAIHVRCRGGVDPGQNNEGFGQITIQHPSLAAADNPSFGADVSLRVDSLAARDRGSIRAAHTRARLLQPLRLRVKVYALHPTTTATCWSTTATLRRAVR